ncbi:MAG: glycoside hydrolase family 9 protein, partial [Lachnospiraceae bacterium]|nr:glycoside hydrolase family 9 protein [Lachnospiraceae bacterium]
MKGKRFIKKLVAIMCAAIMVIVSLNVGGMSTKAATSIDLMPYMTTSGSATATVLANGEKPAVQLNINLPEALNEKSEFQSAGVKSLSVTFTVSNYSAYSGETAGVMAYFMDNSSWTWNGGGWQNLSSGSVTATLDMSNLNWGSGTKVGKIGIQLCNLAENSTVTYNITSAYLVADSNPLSGDSTGGTTGGTAVAPDNNYAKLLQYSLYFYDANMCGDEVGEHTLLSWRNDCHTYDKYSYRRSDGSSVTVDLTGGFHDAGDHVKFGLPEAYAAFTLGMSYDTDKNAYVKAAQVEHLQTITTHFADYLVDCTVLNSAGNSVEAFCVQVGQGGGSYDHGYWGAPEAQPQNNRTAYFSSSSAPHTDIVSLSAAALAMQYKNFGGDEYLKTAKLLFEYAKNNSKSVGTTSSTFYVSSNWEDDYCLAALLLYQITGDSSYKTEFDKYKSASAAMKPYWPLGWDNVGPAVAYYAGDSGKLYTLMNIGNGTTFADGYRCIDNWGSARYNTSMQYTGLLYDEMTGTNSYRSWAEGQMGYILGDNSYNKCFVVGYNSNSATYPHHRAASGYTGGDKGTTAQKYVLMGALVGGPKSDGSYVDSASDYVCNEVAIDYNATLVAAAAALYDEYTGDTTTQRVDGNYHIDSSSSYGDGTGTGGNTGNTGSTGGNTGNTGNTNPGTQVPEEPVDPEVVKVMPEVSVSYRTHIERVGWESWRANGVMGGTSGRSLRLEGINVTVAPTSSYDNFDLGIQYTTHCESYGWLPWSADGDMSGTEGESKRLESIKIQLTGEHAKYYDVYYRVHAESYGWLGWAKDGAPAGTAGYSKRLEGIQIVVVKKDASFNQNMENITSKRAEAFVAKPGNSPIVNYPSTSNTNPVVPGADTPNVAYRTHVEKYGWQAWKYNAQMSGTSGESKRLEGIEIKLTNKDYEGGIAYTTHVEKYAWQGTDLSNPATWRQNGAMA